MPPQVTFAVTSGPRVGQQHLFTERTTALIGAGRMSHPLSQRQGPSNRITPSLPARHQPARGQHSRPGQPDRDIHQRPAHRQARPRQSAEEGAQLRFAEYSLKHGDEIRVGRIVLRSGHHFAGFVRRVPDGDSRGGKREKPTGQGQIHLREVPGHPPSADKSGTFLQALHRSRAGGPSSLEFRRKRGCWTCSGCAVTE